MYGRSAAGIDDRAVLLLIVLENRDQRAADGEARSVQRVHELRLAGAAGAELDVRAARLERLGVAAGRDLAIRLLARQPHLDVVGLRRREAHVAGAQQHRAVRQLEPLQHFLGVRASALRARRTTAPASSASRARPCRTDAGGSARARPGRTIRPRCGSTACRRCSGSAARGRRESRRGAGWSAALRRSESR